MILRNELKNIDGHKCPVIMMTGTYDYLTPPEATENTARQIKGGVYIEMPDIGHFPMSENHELFRVYLIEALKIIKKEQINNERKDRNTTKSGSFKCR